MDQIKAHNLESLLVGKDVGGWHINSLIDFGKSAAVFHASREEFEAAVKIFDDNMIKKYGSTSQLKRIERQKTLIGKHHPNLVRIYNGGYDKITKNHFIVMEFIDGANISQVLKEIPYDNVSHIIEKLAQAAGFLEDHKLCHRDIKPENIAIRKNFTHTILLDLGVLRPFGDASATDGDGVQAFVGTLQYSSPEFLLRQESDTLEGWRSLTFYQLGGVLHDLIMHKPLFEDYKYPYAKLVNAVQKVTPEIKSDNVAQDLLSLAARCLVKDPDKRLELVTWDDFRDLTQHGKTTSAKQIVLNRVAVARANMQPTEKSETELELESTALLNEAREFLKVSIASIRASSDAIPRGTVYQSDSETKTQMVEAIFEADKSCLIRDDLKCIFNIIVEDISARIITICASASLGSVTGNTPPADYRKLFQGPYNGDAIFADIEQFIFEMIALAQDAPPMGEQEGVWLSEECRQWNGDDRWTPLGGQSRKT